MMAYDGHLQYSQEISAEVCGFESAASSGEANWISFFMTWRVWYIYAEYLIVEISMLDYLLLCKLLVLETLAIVLGGYCHDVLKANSGLIGVVAGS